MTNRDRDRFWSKVEKHDADCACCHGCWVWTGAATNKYGHSQFRAGEVTRYVHRIAYEELRGVIPEGLVLDHLCRRPRCVNPDHLEPVTLGENTRRGVRAPSTHCRNGHLRSGPGRCGECRRIASSKTGRRRGEPWTHCRRGHELTADNVYVHPDGHGRECLTCVRLRARRRNAKGVAAALNAR